MNAKYTLQTFQTDVSLFETIASFIIDIANKSIAKTGKFTLVLSGGNTPNKLYTLLASDIFNKKMPWKNTFVFWGDERCVALDDKLNNAHVAISLLLDKVDIPTSNIYPVPVNLSPADAASEYEKQIKNFFGDAIPKFDLILLGMGDNAHTASLFPYTEVINEKEHLVKEVYVEEQKMFRVTMTAPLINYAHNIAFLVTGKEKAETLNTVLHASFLPEKYPAQLIKPEDGNLFWFVNAEAASLLQ
ncbi:MAG: 6-phosphogluconolactonase [Ferruginibacter sp.]